MTVGVAAASRPIGNPRVTIAGFSGTLDTGARQSLSSRLATVGLDHTLALSD
jgi:hypothetical protein